MTTMLMAGWLRCISPLLTADRPSEMTYILFLYQRGALATMKLVWQEHYIHVMKSTDRYLKKKQEKGWDREGQRKEKKHWLMI